MHKSALTLVSLATTLAACSGGTTTSHTMELLRAGDAKVCIAADVEESLRKLVLPKTGDTTGFTVSFSDATLENFDKVVTRAGCHANLRADGPDGEIVPKTGFDFTVVPSAQNPDTFITSASLEAYAGELATAIETNAADKNAKHEADATQAKLIATVKDGWLLGRWVRNDQGTDACSVGPYYNFARNHRFGAEDSKGSWELSGLKLTVIGLSSAVSGAITEADQNSFSLDLSGGGSVTNRRCSAREMAPPPEDDPDPDEPPSDGSGINAENPVNGVR
jgi:hypothetical protein